MAYVGITLSEKLKEELKEKAEQNRRSLSSEIVFRLEASLVKIDGDLSFKIINGDLSELKNTTKYEVPNE